MLLLLAEWDGKYFCVRLLFGQILCAVGSGNAREIHAGASFFAEPPCTMPGITRYIREACLPFKKHRLCVCNRDLIQRKVNGMISFFSRIFGSKKNENSLAHRFEMAKKLDGKHIRYVTERTVDPVTGNYDDLVIGREGALIVRGDEFLVYASADVLFRTKLETLTASELMSHDGAVISGPDMEHDGRQRTIIAYYTYYI